MLTMQLVTLALGPDYRALFSNIYTIVLALQNTWNCDGKVLFEQQGHRNSFITDFSYCFVPHYNFFIDDYLTKVLIIERNERK